jgi:hypothetical protein
MTLLPTSLGLMIAAFLRKIKVAVKIELSYN